MPIQNEKFSLLVSDSSGNPLTGSLVELRKDAIERAKRLRANEREKRISGNK